MKLFTIEHQRAGMIFLAIFALAAMISFSSCEIQRDCPGAGRKNGYVGYSDRPAKAIKGSTRKSY